MNSLMTALEISVFNSSQWTLLLEYIEVMKPIAQALNILQGDVGAGWVIPSIRILRQKLVQVHVCDATQLVTFLLEQLPVRFQRWEAVTDFLMASVCYPKFKMDWTTEEEKLWLLQRLRREVESPPECQGDESCSDSSSNDFFRKKRNNVPLLPWMHISKTKEKT